MDYFLRDGKGQLYCEDLSLHQLAEEYGTPLYVYSEATLRHHCRVLKKAFSEYPTRFFFAVKANSNGTFLKIVRDEGYGCDIVSGGELSRALRAGFHGSNIIFSGVGKSEEELLLAMRSQILSFQVESQEELQVLEKLAAGAKQVLRVSLRVNPNIDAKTNPKITTGMRESKFGIALESVQELLRQWSDYPSLELVGLSCHLGSQLLDLNPLRQASQSIAKLSEEAAARLGKPLKYLDMGGGLGVCYDLEVPPSIEEYADAILSGVRKTGCELFLEPGRVLAGNSGILLSRVVRVKKTESKNFIVIDASMTELLRPALYGAHHRIDPVQKTERDSPGEISEVVGPVCESSDVLVSGVALSSKPGDLLAIRTCGAYGYVMSSNYNSRPKPAEVFVSKSKSQIVSRRETYEDLWRLEP